MVSELNIPLAVHHCLCLLLPLVVNNSMLSFEITLACVGGVK